MRKVVITDDGAIPVAANMLLASTVVAANLAAGVLVPLVLLPRSPLWLLPLAPLALLTVPHWGLIHEAVHGHLHPSRAANEALGRLLGVLFGAAFPVLRFGHLSHHSLNSRPAERAELYDPAAEAPRWRVAAVYYARLLIGLYLAEFASSLLFFLPDRLLRPLVRRTFYDGEADARGIAERAERHLLEPGRLALIRLDGGVALAWIACCLLLYGGHAWAFALALLGRGAVVSFLDNAPHYGGEVDDTGQGYDMQAPGLVMPLIMNTNLHGTHHRHPNLPWTGLPRAFAADAAPAAGSYFVVPWRQLRGPIPQPVERGAGETAAA